MILLDSSVLIDHFRKQRKERTLFYKLARQEHLLCISSITHYEVGVGNRVTHRDYWETLSKSLVVLPFDQPCAETAIGLFQQLTRSNRMIDLADLMIGATALTHGIPLATFNVRHFERLDGLTIVSS